MIRVKSAAVLQDLNLEEFFVGMPLQWWYAITWKYFKKSTSYKDGEKMCEDVTVASRVKMSHEM